MVGRRGKFFPLDRRERPYVTFFLTSLSCRKTSDLHLILEDFYKKRIPLKNCVRMKIFLIKLSGIPHKHRKGSSLPLQKLYKSNFYLFQQQGSLF